MNNNTYRFNVGEFNCIAVSDGSVSGEGAAEVLFTNAPKKALKQALQAYKFPTDLWNELFNCLVIKTREHCVLIDTGLGISQGEPNTGKLLQNLHKVGVEPADVDTVIISHAHGDHIGGIINLNGEANFPQARYYIRKEEWDYWTSPDSLENPSHQWMVEFVNKNLLPLHDRFQFLTRNTEIVPGITSLIAPGHTPGNMALIIESNGKQLFYLGDILLHSIHLEHPDWYSSFDSLPAETVNTRQWWLKRASIENALIFLYHFDFPGLGYAIPQKRNWEWQALRQPEME